MKAEVGGGQDKNLWEQFGKLMFDWEEGTAVWMSGQITAE